MKRTLAIALAAAFAIAAIGGPAIAGDKVDPIAKVKVEICHLNGVSDPIPTFYPTIDPRMFYLGQVLSVPMAAVSAHEGHGDSVAFRTDEAGLANVFLSAGNNELKAWKNADCFVTVYP